MSQPRVLVTGHLGYIGSCLVPLLLEAGFDVTGCDTDLFGQCDFGASPLPLANLGRDIRDLQLEDLHAYWAVVHLAGLSNDPLGNLDEALTDQVNAQATIRLGELASQAGISRFLFSSSCSTYGAAGEDALDETASLAPVTAYGRSKVAAEQGLARLATDSFSPVFMRNATVYGSSPRIRFDLVVNNLAAWAHTTGKVLLKSQGLAWRPLVHVQDVCSAFVAALNAPREAIHGRAINIGRTQENFRVRDLAQMVHQACPGSELTMREGALADARNYRVNCDLAAQLLPNWQPQWSVEDGISELLAEYRRVGLTEAEFEGDRYQRLAHLQARMGSGEVDDRLRPVLVPGQSW